MTLAKVAEKIMEKANQKRANNNIEKSLKGANTGADVLNYIISSYTYGTHTHWQVEGCTSFL